jgi:hypothetical protein
MNFIKQTTLCIALLCGLTNVLKSQVETEDVFKVTFLNPGVAYEKSLGGIHTVYGQAFVNFASSITEDYYDEYNINFFVEPALSLQYRLYYNLNRRNDRGKNTARNSGNYFTVINENRFTKAPLGLDDVKEAKIRPVIAGALGWGMQRNYNSRFSLDFYLGAGAKYARTTTHDNYGQLTSLNKTSFAFIGQINLGIWLGSRE